MPTTTLRRTILDPTNEAYAAKAKELASVLKNCPVCSNGFSGHNYALLASLILKSTTGKAPPERELVQLFQEIKDHAWPRLRNYRSWNSGSDNLEAYALTCPTDAMSIVAIKTHFELFEGTRFLYSEVLRETGARALQETFADAEWHPMNYQTSPLRKRA